MNPLKNKSIVYLSKLIFLVLTEILESTAPHIVQLIHILAWN